MAEKLADFKIEVDVESDDLLLFGDAIHRVEKGVWTTHDALIHLKAQVEDYQNQVNNAKEGSEEWVQATRNLKAAQEELSVAVSANGRREFVTATKSAKELKLEERETAKAARELAKEQRNAGKEAERFAKKAVVFLGQYLAIKKTFSSVMGFAAEGEELSRMAQLSGTSAESIEKLGIALKNYGGSASSASSTLGKLNKHMKDLKFGKGGKLGQAAIRYGLDVNAQTPEQMLMNIAKRMEGLGSLQQVNLGRMLGLDDATIMMLQQGVEGVRKELDKAGKSTAFSQENIEKSRKMLNAYREFQNQLKQVKAVMVRDLLPVFQTLFERLGKLANYLKEHPKLLKAVGIAAAVVFGGLAALLNPPLAIITAIGTAILLLVDDWATFKEGGESALKSIWEWLEIIIEAVKGFIGGIEELGEKIGEICAKIINWLSKIDWSKLNPMNWFGDDDEIKTVKGNIQYSGSAIDIGQSYINAANATPVNSMTPTQMSMMNTNQSNNKTINYNIGQMNVEADNAEEFGQSFNNNGMLGFADGSL